VDIIFYRKINNAQLWDKIQKLRELIKSSKTFKKRVCWKCGKELNIYDFLSDNVEYTPKAIFKLWQNPLLEFHCCECFKLLKSHELQAIENISKTRKCLYCGKKIDLYTYNKRNNYLKIYELKEIWQDPKAEIFCDSLCRKRYNREASRGVLNLKFKNK
jgi:hypothetical protein